MDDVEDIPTPKFKLYREETMEYNEEFDLQKFIKAYAHAGFRDVAKALFNDDTRTKGIGKYLAELQRTGSDVIRDHSADQEEIDMLVALVLGQVISSIHANRPEEFGVIVEMLKSHKDLIVGLCAYSVACGIALSIKEEWR